MRIKDSINNWDKVKFSIIPLLGLIPIIITNILGTIKPEDTVVLIVTTILNYTAFLFAFEYDYITNDIVNNIHFEISKLVLLLAVLFACSSALAIFKIPCSIVPAMTVLLASVLPFYTGMELSIFVFIYTAVLYAYTSSEVVIYLTLLLMGLLFAKAFKSEKNRQFLIFVIFGIIFVMFYLLQFVNGRGNDYRLLINNCVVAIINIIIMQIGYYLMKKFGGKDVPLAVETILGENFPLVKLMKNSSLSKYNHARKVAVWSSRVARIIGIDAELCMSGGFYYALCDNDEDDPIEFACSLGRQNALPPQVITIVSAYKGIKKPIRTREGAVIEIVDELITELPKLESNEVPRQIVIISRLNDISASGIIDESGLSMNSFIKMRDYLVKEMENL
ncbi:MAG: hypothetical protein K6E39_00280 [Lachnospiraceae bacterium]|nr:hypothetical protein [Lachnospiraceae bacterium]